MNEFLRIEIHFTMPRPLSPEHHVALHRPTVILKENPPHLPSPPDSATELLQVVQQMRDAQDDPERVLLVQVFDTSFVDDFLRLLPQGSGPVFRPLLELIASDTETLVLKEKIYHNRPRPKEVAKRLQMDFEPATSDTDHSPSYPSGHMACARIMAHALAENFPHKESTFMKMADLVGQSRVDGGLHFPSDIQAGALWADLLWNSARRSGLRTQELISNEKIKKPL